jgi:hypothetical protein
LSSADAQHDRTDAAVPPAAPPIAAEASERNAAPVAAAEVREPDLEREDVRCISCGYNLRLLEKDGRCPECGTPVERSLHGDALLYSSPGYLRRLRQGVQLIYWGLIARIAVGLVSAGIAFVHGVLLGMGGTGDAIHVMLLALLIIADVAISVAVIVGWWLLSTPDPAVPPEDRRNRLRWWVRALAVALGVVGIASSAGDIAASTTGPNAGATFTNALVVAGVALGVVVIVAWAAFYFLSMKYFSWIASRIPNQPLVEFASRMRWLGPVLFVVGAPCIMLGPLAALILYLVLVRRLMRQVQAVERRQQDELATAWERSAAG